METFQKVKFNEATVIKCLKALVPESHLAARSSDIKFHITAKVKKGKITKLELDNYDVTPYTNLIAAGENISTILKHTKDYRFGFTGTVKFDVTKENGEIVTLYISLSHLSFNNKTRNN